MDSRSHAWQGSREGLPLLPTAGAVDLYRAEKPAMKAVGMEFDTAAAES